MQSNAYPSSAPNADSPPGPGAHRRREQDDALWGAFASAQTAAEFCSTWLPLQCLQVRDVRAALLLLEQGSGTFVPAAVWPNEQTDVTYLGLPITHKCFNLYPAA